MRVLHLIDPATPGGGACTLRLLAEPLERIRSVHQDTIVIGTARHLRLARACGVPAIGAVPAPLRHPGFAQRGVRRAVAVWEAAHGRYDLVHAWTPTAALVATLAFPDRPRAGTLSVGPVSGANSRLLAMSLERHVMELFATSTAVRDEYRAMGIAEDHLSVMPPGVRTELVEDHDRASIRRRWGVGPDTLVLGALSEPVGWADARHAASVLSRVAVAGVDVRLVVHPTATRRVEAEQWLARLKMDHLLLADDEIAEPWRVVAGLDAALLIGGNLNSPDLSASGSPFASLTGGGRRLRPMPGIMPLLWAMAGGVPVIAESSSAVIDVVDEGETGWLVRQHDINTAGERLLRLCEDRTLAGRIGARARERVHERFHVSATCVQLKESWERILAGRPARVPEEGRPVVEQFDEGAERWVERSATAPRARNRGRGR